MSVAYQKLLVNVDWVYHVFITIQLRNLVNNSPMEDVKAMEITLKQKFNVKQPARLNLSSPKYTNNII